MEFERKLEVPSEVKRQYPVNKNVSAIVAQKREELKAIFEGRDNRKVLIIGPCSADNEDAVLDYMSRLVKLQEKVQDKLLFVPRIYTNKPRTTGEGYKGLLHQPDPSGKPDMYKGLLATRHLHMKAVDETGMIFADEMLYPENYKYLDDVLGYVAVGARSVENQQHRLTASGIEVPVGMKNPTSGDYAVMMNAIQAAQKGHTFSYRGWEAHSQGNPWCHSILRGSTDKYGVHLQNYHYEDLIRLCDSYDERPVLVNPAVIVDTNHSNSKKNPFEQPRIIADVLHSCRNSERIAKIVKGFMVESYLEDGSQHVGEGCYGKSITDPCLGWEKSEKLIFDIAERL
ncbi:MAG: 3-deoxy-7-phosphoheptulonate synthase [Sphaerochaetaceae bacterium]|nr:3-deoxy-7-phosphoheptulonate synthase [Sphaerochaetaceae bacterium]